MSIGYQAIGDIGLWGEGTTWNGVVGLSHSTTGGFGAWGQNDTGGTGVVGESRRWHGTAGFSDSTIGGAGVYGEHRGSDGIGVSGSGAVGVFGSGSLGVMGTSVDGVAVDGAVTGGGMAIRGVGPVAGHFEGLVRVFGDLTVINGNKPFKIDHPLDPQNKYLSHNAVEAPERKNVYDGVAQLDQDGTASVELPEWCEALNGDFRYQLTAVGGAAPNLHVAEEVSENRFRIAGGEGGMKVCWQVTGSRKDAWAAANPFEVEEEKPQEERGRYLQPDLYDAPEEQSIMRAGMGEETLRQMMREEPPQAPQMSPPGLDRPPEERLRQTYELRRQAEAQEHRQQIDELRQQIEELRRQQ